MDLFCMTSVTVMLMFICMLLKRKAGGGKEHAVLLLDGGPAQECARVMILPCSCEFPAGI